MKQTPLLARLLLAALLVSLPASSYAQCGPGGRGPGCGGGSGGGQGGHKKKRPGQDKPPKGPGCGAMWPCTAEGAHQAVEAAIGKAARNLGWLALDKRHPRNAVAYPYADEVAAYALGGEAPADGVAQSLKLKDDYWKPVEDTLLTAKRRTSSPDSSSETDGQKLKKIGAEIKSAQTLTRDAELATAIVADIVKDQELLKKVKAGAADAEPNEALVKRKTGIYEKLKQFAAKDGENPSRQEGRRPTPAGDTPRPADGANRGAVDNNNRPIPPLPDTPVPSGNNNNQP